MSTQPYQRCGLSLLKLKLFVLFFVIYTFESGNFTRNFFVLIVGFLFSIGFLSTNVLQLRPALIPLSVWPPNWDSVHSATLFGRSSQQHKLLEERVLDNHSSVVMPLAPFFGDDFSDFI